MNIKMIFNTLGRTACAEAVLMLLPLTVCFIYGEGTWFGFAVTAAISLLLGLLLCFCFRTKNSVIYAKEGFAIVSLAWICMSAVGALPFVLSGDIPSPANPPSGCKFHTRCPQAMEICKHICPKYQEQEPGHFVACHCYQEK